MFAAKPILAAVLAIGMGYVAYPYVTLYRLGEAIHTGNAATLRSLIDWPAVREGIKEDICDNAADTSPRTVSAGRLPAFGASFVRGIAAGAVDRRVTPKGLVDMTHQSDTGAATSIQVTWAFFHDPTDFIIDLRTAGQRDPIRLRMRLQNARWRVTRVWLPNELLAAANAHT